LLLLSIDTLTDIRQKHGTVQKGNDKTKDQSRLRAEDLKQFPEKWKVLKMLIGMQMVRLEI
jgi:hypothetical protein